MSSLTPRILRLPVRIDRADIPVDADTGGSIRLWAGSPARLRFAFFFGETLLNSFAGCSGLAVQIKSLSPGGAPPAPDAPWLAERVVTDFNTSVTAEEWEAGTAWHAEVALDGDELNHTAGAYWLVAVALLDEPTTLLAGRFDLLPDGYGSASGAPTPPSPPYTQAEADARFWRRTEVAAAGQDAGADQVPRGNSPALVNGAAAYAALAPVRALVAQGKTRRLLVPGATSAAPLADSGHDLALPGAFAGDEEIVLGGDPRLGLRGGVACSGRVADVGGFGCSSNIQLGSTWSAAIVIRSNWSAGLASGIFALMCEGTPYTVRLGANIYGPPTGEMQLRLGIGSIGSDLSTSYWPLPGVLSDYAGKPLCLVLVCVSGVLTAWLNERPLEGFVGTLPGMGSCTVTRVLGGVNGYDQIGGWARSLAFFNYALIVPELSLLKSGEWTADMVVQCKSLWSASSSVNLQPGGFANPLNAASTWSGGTLHAVQAADGAYGGASVIVSPALPAGTKVRFSGLVTACSGNPYWLFKAGPGQAVIAGELNQTGIFSFVVTLPNDECDQVHGRFEGPGAASITIENLKVDVLGCAGRYDPHSCSEDAWKDSSGNGRHLRFGAGVTALDPRPQTVRIPVTLPDSVIPGVGAPSGVFEADLTLVAAGDAAGELAAIKAGDAVDLRLKDRLPNGMLLKQGARVVSDGLVAASVINLNGSDEPTGALGAELTHHL